MLQNSEKSRSLPEKVRERRSPAFPPHYTSDLHVVYLEIRTILLN